MTRPAQPTPQNPPMGGGWVRSAPWLLAAVPLVFLLLVQMAPAARLAWEGWHSAGTEPVGGWLTPWQDSYLRGRIAWSFTQAAASALAALALGLPVAWVLARYAFAGRALVMRSLMLPFVVPTLVAALGVLSLMGPNGWLAQWGGPDAQGTPWLLLYGNLFFNLCVVVRAGTDALGRVSASRIAAARTLGASPWRVFVRVEWPAIAPWLMSAMCLVFLYCFSGFGMALVLGGQDYSTAEVEIYTLVAHELELARASVLAVWMMVLTMAVAWAYALLEARTATHERADRLPRRRVQTAADRVALTGALGVLVLFCALPLMGIARAAINSGANAWAVLWDEDAVAALWNTVRFTVLAVLLATVLGIAHALAARRSMALRTLVFLPFVVSPVMVGFGLLLLYPQWSGSFTVLVCAYALLAYPFVAKSLASALDAMPPHLAMAARTLGASPWRVFWRITLPLLRPSLRRGMAFAAATAVGEFAVTLFLSRPEWATLTTLIYAHLGRPGAANLSAAMVLSCALMGLALCAFVLIEWQGHEEER